MKKLNKITLIFAVMFVFALSVFAADYAYPDGYEPTKYAMSQVVVSSVPNQAYTGKAVTPNVTVKHNNVTLVEGTDYTVTYTNNIKIGTAKVKVEGIGIYEGTKELSFKILKNIASAKVSGVKEKTYTGSKQTQSLKVKYGSTTLKNGEDYTISYTNNVNAGTAKITITGKGSYAGTKTVTFKIARRSISKLTYSKVSSYTYTGKAITPNVTVKYGKKVLVKNTDYTVAYSKNVNSGTATITITGKGNYAGTKKITFGIKDRSISSATVTGLKSKTYTGSKQYQSLTLTYNGIVLKNGTHYTLSYKSNTNAGTASVTITGKGNFNGSKTLKFKIWDRNINELDITASKSLGYTGNKREPSVTVKYGSKTLKKNTDYKVTYSNNVNVGTGKITVTGIGNYTGTKVLTFEITKRNITSVSVKGLEEKKYTGGKLTQSLKLTYAGNTLKNGTHYKLTYANNVKAGTASVTITGIGNFYGEKTLTYKIARRSISKLTYNKVSNYTYTGKAITPSITIKYGKTTLVKDTDYTVAYSNNVKAGIATITITGKGNFAGTKKITFSINKRSIASATVEGLASKAYTGKKLYQSLTLTYNEMTLKNGTDYTLSYKNNTAIGKATVTIAGKGNFNGSKTLTFKINPPAPKMTSAVTTDKNIKVVWAKVSSATGYELYMAKDDGAYTKLTTITKNSTVNYTVKNLADGQYSFKVRAYKTVGKTKYYSSYSDVKISSIVTITVPAPTIKFGEKVTGPDGSVQYILSMENTSELDGVQVYYATSEKGEYKLQREYSKADFTSYDIAVEIPKNGHYYFKVRGYKTVNETKYYGEYSNVVDYNNVVVEPEITTVDYIIGKNIEVGTYKITPIIPTRPAVVEEYFEPEVYENLGPGMGFAVADINTYRGYITIDDNIEGITVENGTVEKVNLDEIEVNIQNKVSNGMYLVGKDITPGAYKVICDSKYVEIEVFNSIVMSDYDFMQEYMQSGYIEVPEDAVAVNVAHGSLEKVDLENYPTDIKQTVSNGTFFVGKDLLPGTYKVTQTEEIEEIYNNIRVWENEDPYGLYINMPKGYIEITEETTMITLSYTTLEKVDLDDVPVNIQTSISEDGVYLVGKDIAPGIYKFVTKDPNVYYDETEINVYDNLKFNWSGTYMGTYEPYGYIEIKESDLAVGIKGLKLTKESYKEVPTNIKTSVSDGIYVVGKDIAPGTYEITTSRTFDCTVSKKSEQYIQDFYWENTTGEMYAKQGFIEIKPTDYFVMVYGGTIEQIDLDKIPVNIKDKVSEGTYIVGKDIAPGTYKIVSESHYTAVELLASLGGEYNEENSYIEAEKGIVYATIDSSTVAVKVGAGVTLELIDISSIPTDLKTTVTDGTYIVGKDLNPGIYKIEAAQDAYECSVRKYSDMHMIMDNMTDELYFNRGYVEILDTDKVVKVYNGKLTKVDLSDIETNPQSTIDTTKYNNMYLVGKEVEPGLYKVTANYDYGYVYTYSKITSKYEYQTNYFSGSNGYIEIKDTDVVVAIYQAKIEKAEDLEPEIKDTVSEGTYIVGKDIAPGLYRATGLADRECLVYTYSDISTDWENQTGYYGGPRGYIEIHETDVTVIVQNGTITKVDLETMPEDYKDTVSKGMYIVGKEVKPGLYRITGENGNYAQVYKYSAISSNWEYQTGHYGGPRGYIEILDTDVTVKVQEGTITRVDLETMPKDYQDTVSNGMYLVGKEVEPGLYKIDSGDLDLYHTVQTYSKITDEYDYRTNYFSGNYGYVEVKETDVIVNVDGTMTRVYADELPENNRTILNRGGMYLVGKDIAPGVYRVIADEDDCSWIDVFSIITSDNNDYYATGNSMGSGYIEILDTDVSVVVRAGSLEKIELDDLPINIKETLSTGLYLVGKDIAPGIYQTGEYSSAVTYSSETASLRNKTQTSSIGTNYGYIEVLDTDFVVEVNGTMTKIDLDNTTPNYKETLNDGMYLVGKDVEPGTYKVISKYYNSNEEYSWFGDVRTYSCVNIYREGIIENEWFYGMYGYIEIKSTDAIVTIYDATIQKVDINNLPQDIQPADQTGIYIVGKDILPGIYTIEGDSWGCANKLSSISKDDVVGGTYYNGNTIEITDQDYAVYIYSVKLILTEQTQVLAMAKEPTKQEETLEVEQEQQEVNIYNEVDIYSEN